MKKGTLILLCGFAGAGKTTMAKRLVESFGCVRISTDEVNDALRAEKGGTFSETSPVAHDQSWERVRAVLEQGEVVVMDTNMCSDRAWENVDALQKTRHKVIVLMLTCSLDRHKARIDHRGETQPEHLNMGGGTFKGALHKYEYLRNLSRDDVIVIDANGTADDVYGHVQRALAQAGVRL